MRVFLDTNVLVSASFWQGASYRILLEIAGGKILGFTSPPVLDEYRRVLKRDFSMSEAEADSAIEKLLGILSMVSPSKSLDIIKDDPADNRILEGALEAKAEILVSQDKHLLKIGKFENIEVIKPEAFLERMKL